VSGTSPFKCLFQAESEHSHLQYTFGTNGNARLAKKEDYHRVDPNHVDFIVDVGNLETTADGVALTLRSDKVGAKITSTRAMHRGKMTVEMQTAWSGGVVTAAVLMGDTDEEADIEFTGNALKAFQSNLFQ
jgi:beta-glucanase (GH16 family)